MALIPPAITNDSSAAVIARFLRARGVDRVFALCGGHIMPIWMRLDAEGIRIVDVRDERAAVYMAHAHSELTGELGVALVTAGPGVTNAMTGIANAHVARAPVLILSGVAAATAGKSRRAAGHDAHRVRAAADALRAHGARARAGLQELDEAVARAVGQGGEPGPVYLDFPVDTLRAPRAAGGAACPSTSRPSRDPRIFPDPAQVARAVDLLWSARRVAGDQRPRRARRRRAAGAPARPPRRAVPRHRREPRPGAGEPSGGGRGDARRGHERGRRRGHARPPARLPARVRLAGNLRQGAVPAHRRLRPPNCATTAAARWSSSRRRRLALEAIVAAAGDRAPAGDRDWAQTVRSKHVERTGKLLTSMRNAAPGSDGRMHPNRLLAALRDALPARRGHRRRRRRLPQLRARRRAGATPISIRDRSAASASARRSASPPPRAARTRSWRCSPATARSASTPWRSTPRRATGAGADRRGQQRQLGDRGARPAGNPRQGRRHAPAVRRPRGDGARFRTARRTRRTRRRSARPRSRARSPTGRRCSTCVVTPEAASSDAKSGLAWVPDLQPLGAWEEAEAAWRAGVPEGGGKR